MNYLKIICVAIVFLLSNYLKAQVSVNVGSPPLWGPVGYPEERYYYLPDVEAYYDVETSMFIYFGNGVWLHRSSLPFRYSNYDLYNGYKVVITGYHGHTPYNDFHKHKIKYKKGYKGGHQKTIGNRPGNGNNKSKGSENNKHQQKSFQNNNNGGNGNNNFKSGGNGENKGGSHGNEKGGSHGGEKGKK